MLRYRTGTAGSTAGAAAAARYFLSETLRPENEALAKYYAGESVPAHLTGMEQLAQAIADGGIEFSDALNELMSAHGRMFGFPEDIHALEDRLSAYIDRLVDRSDRRDTLAAEGGTVARVREDLDPRLAERLGIDTTRPVTQRELSNLLAGVRADTGEAVQGKQIQHPTRSVVEVFALGAKVLPSPDAIDHVLAGRRADGEAPRSATGNGEPLADKVVEGGRKRFLAAYELPSAAELTTEHVYNIKAGKSAIGRFLDTGDVLRKLNATKPPISYTDCIWSADKSVSTCFALAPTEAERAIIVQAHQSAVATAMAYVEDTLGFMRKGKAGKDGVEKGAVAWVVADHYTSRPTAEVAMMDKDGQAYTEFQTIPMRIADPQLHSHALLLNYVLSPTGRVGAMDGDNLDGLVKELGGVYQAAFGTRLRAAGIDARLDPETGAARIMDVPAYVPRHFSKRTHDIEAAAHCYAAEAGLDWDSMTPAHQLKMLRKGVEETRQPKRASDLDSDFTLWRKQAADELGYQHRSVLRPGQEQGLRPDAERHRHAYDVSLPLIEDALSKRAKLGAQEFREFATRGLVDAGISDDPARDIKAVMRLYRELGVRQDGEMTPIWFGKDVPLRGKERWSVTTAMHVDEERQVISLAKTFGNDRSGALSHAALERASQAFLDSCPNINPTGAQWIKQRAVIEQAGTGPMLTVIVGVAGAGKSTILSPIIAASQEADRHVYITSRGWKQSQDLRKITGVQQKDVAAISVFLNRVKKGTVKLNAKSTVILEELSQIGRGDMLQLLKLQQKHGFRMLAIGDPAQGGSIDPAVMGILVETLADKVPHILTSVRASTEREREISSKFRDGEAEEAIAMKLEDGTAKLVAGGRAATIREIAAKWHELTEADPTLKPTIGTASNRDAHEIGVAIRQQLQEAGKIGLNKIKLGVLQRGENGVQPLALAEGDKVRVFNRVWVDGHFASNGDVVDVLHVSAKGMTARNEDGREAFIGWNKLIGAFEETPRLAYGHSLTIDAAQGTTSRVHFDAILSGSWQQQGGKGYVNESRQVETTLMFVNEAAERKKIFSKIPRGDFRPIKDAGIWKHVADNLNRPTTKASATDFMRNGTELYRGGLSDLPMALEPAERRERAGEARMTLRQRLERQAAEIAPRIQRAVDYMQQRIAQAVEGLAPRITQAQRDQARTVKPDQGNGRRQQEHTHRRGPGISI